jgi:hypothetical protein
VLVAHQQSNVIPGAGDKDVIDKSTGGFFHKLFHNRKQLPARGDVPSYTADVGFDDTKRGSHVALLLYPLTANRLFVGQIGLLKFKKTKIDKPGQSLL